MLDVEYFGDAEVLDTYRRLASLLDALSTPPSDEKVVVDRLFAEIEAISNSSVLQKLSSNPKLSERLETRLGWSDKEAKALSEDDLVAIAETLDEVRLRCIATAMLLKQRDFGSSDDEIFNTVSEVVDGVGVSEKSPIVYGPAQVAHAEIGNTFVVLLPSMEDPRKLSSVIDYIHELFERTGTSKHWVVDFSAVRQMPLLLVANVLTYRQKLRDSNSDLFLCWIRSDSFRDIFKERMTKAFSLREMGGFYHSASDAD